MLRTHILPHGWPKLSSMTLILQYNVEYLMQFIDYLNAKQCKTHMALHGIDHLPYGHMDVWEQPFSITVQQRNQVLCHAFILKLGKDQNSEYNFC